MGQITIQLSGSFGTRVETFSAIAHGHQQAVADAIAYLATAEMGRAIIQDHELHSDGHAPSTQFGRLTAPA